MAKKTVDVVVTSPTAFTLASILTQESNRIVPLMPTDATRQTMHAAVLTDDDGVLSFYIEVVLLSGASWDCSMTKQGDPNPTFEARDMPLPAVNHVTGTVVF